MNKEYKQYAEELDLDETKTEQQVSPLNKKRFLCAEDNELNAEILEAAKAIRSGSNPLGKEIPIIAMTANAFVEDMRASKAAGMNAHLSKPINIEQLERLF